jgi:hypothetical protein
MMTINDTDRIDALQRYWEGRGGDCNPFVPLNVLLDQVPDEDRTLPHETNIRDAIDDALRREGRDG